MDLDRRCHARHLGYPEHRLCGKHLLRCWPDRRFWQPIANAPVGLDTGYRERGQLHQHGCQHPLEPPVRGNQVSHHLSRGSGTGFVVVILQLSNPDREIRWARLVHPSLVRLSKDNNAGRRRDRLDANEPMGAPGPLFGSSVWCIVGILWMGQGEPCWLPCTVEDVADGRAHYRRSIFRPSSRHQPASSLSQSTQRSRPSSSASLRQIQPHYVPPSVVQPSLQRTASPW